MIGDDGFSPNVGDDGAQGVAVIGLIGKNAFGPEPFEQGRRLGDIAALTGRQDQAQRASATVDGHMDLGGQSTSGTPQSLVLVPPFPVAAC